MLTIENLRKYGANVDEGLQRCVNNEQLYLTLVNRFLDQNAFPDLKTAILDRDLEKAFHISHSLKGVIGNLSLSPLYDIIYQMTELLRNRTEMDYSDYIQRYEMSYSLLAALR
ncbi:MAG: Hpt domain-containing protein [Bacilli bacterium]|nr:Hpt domain-containing protein [Bacilli bacterium]